jgi:indolepyruvate ferredoxin oxidoreductase alpha subunit
LVEGFVSRHENVLVVEEPDAAIELQLSNRTLVMGRHDGTVPDQGELTAAVLTGVLGTVLAKLDVISEPWPAAGQTEVEALVADLDLPVRPASLCPGCPHRSAFYAIRSAFGKKGIYTSDIGCYTLGLNLDGVDTCLDMGAAVSMATGFYHAYKTDEEGAPPIVATIGDSTFYHGGLPGLATAVYSDARYIIVILDNMVTAMTGMQPTLAGGKQADGSMGNALPLEDACKGLGVSFIRVHDPYDIEGMKALLKEAQTHCRSPEGRVAVIIARHPCLLHDRRNNGVRVRVAVSEDCNGCGLCRLTFECPALIKGAPVEGKKNRFYTKIDRRICADCGQCIEVCRRGALTVVAD